MDIIDTLWGKDKLVQKTMQIEDSLYEELVKLSENMLDASVSKIINACVYEFSHKDKLTMYQQGDLTKHSVIFRKSAVKKLADMKAKFNIPQYVILNIAIKSGIEKIKKSRK